MLLSEETHRRLRVPPPATTELLDLKGFEHPVTGHRVTAPD